jgi:hypothetical protein
MKWITRRNLHIDRTASAWLIRGHIDRRAEFEFVAAGTDPATLDGHSFDMRGGEFSHVGEQCTFEVLLTHFDLGGDPALVEMGRIIRDADVPPRRTRRPEAAGIDALLLGFQVIVRDDYEKLRLTAPLYDALYAYCRTKVASSPRRQGAPRPRLHLHRRASLGNDAGGGEDHPE